MIQHASGWGDFSVALTANGKVPVNLLPSQLHSHDGWQPPIQVSVPAKQASARNNAFPQLSSGV